jgi:predicted nucleic acid-binding protein
MEKIVVDTDVIIDYVRGLEQAAEFRDRTVADFRYTTIINSLEVLQGAQNRIEMRKLDKFLVNTFQVLQLTPRSSALALELIRKHALPDGLRAGDALIAALTIENGATLVTGNYRHFCRIRNLKLVNFKKG